MLTVVLSGTRCDGLMVEMFKIKCFALHCGSWISVSVRRLT